MDDSVLGGSKDGKDAASAPSGAPSTEGPSVSSLFPLSSTNQHRIGSITRVTRVVPPSLNISSAVISGSR
jgi:hypothetical protein